MTGEPQLRLTLAGPAVRDGRLPLSALTELGHHLQTLVSRIALALRGETSLRPGRLPEEVVNLTRLDLVGFRKGSAVLELALSAHERPLDSLDLGLRALEELEEGLYAWLAVLNSRAPGTLASLPLRGSSVESSSVVSTR